MGQHERDLSQGILEFGEHLNIPEGYSLQRAQAASIRRHKRIGNIARTGGFRRRVDGLFVPHSGTENSAIIDIPINKARQEEDAASQRVYEKYKDSEDVSTKQVDLWAYFSGQKAHSEIRRKYRNFRGEALINAARIGKALEPMGGLIVRDNFTFDPDYRIDPERHTARTDILAYNSVLKYFIDLEVFIGVNPEVIGSKGQRKWAQLRHHRVYKERMERAHLELNPLAEDLFAERVDEAYWSHFSRGRFWVGVINEHEDFIRDNQRQESLRLGNQSLPPEYYESLLGQT